MKEFDINVNNFENWLIKELPKSNTTKPRKVTGYFPITIPLKNVKDTVVNQTLPYLHVGFLEITFLKRTVFPHFYSDCLIVVDWDGLLHSAHILLHLPHTPAEGGLTPTRGRNWFRLKQGFGIYWNGSFHPDLDFWSMDQYPLPAY